MRRSYATLVGPTSLEAGRRHHRPPIPVNVNVTSDEEGDDDGKRRRGTEQRPSSLTPLDLFLLACHRSLLPLKQPTTRQLLDQLGTRDGRQLDQTLSYEPTPSLDRRLAPSTSAPTSNPPPAWNAGTDRLVRMATGSSRRSEDRDGDDDGVVLIAHIVPSPDARSPPRIVTCHGIALESQPLTRLVATCAHPLSHLGPVLGPSASSHAHPPSASIVLTGSGAVHPVVDVATCIADSDVLILQAGDPIPSPGSSRPEPPASAWKTAPVSPYPLPIGTAVRAHRTGEERWEQAEITEYKDAMGLSAKPGTYDFLSTFSFSAPPASGASGGPVVGPSGSVVGLIRGSRADYGDRQARGFAVVSERLWEVFKLPSFKLASEKRKEEAERAASAEGRGKGTK